MKKSTKKPVRASGGRSAVRKAVISKRKEPMSPVKKLPKARPVFKPKNVIKASSPFAKTKFTPTKRKLTAAEVREFEHSLLAIRDRLSGQISSLKSDSLKRQDEVNSVEDGTDAFERQFALNIASTENDSIFEIEEALRRIDAGTFGTCEVTGEPIELERLKAIPYARYSLAAQAEMEKGKAPHRQSAVLRAL